jgi:sporulation protein YlmC with PRC-barrel domain
MRNELKRISLILAAAGTLGAANAYAQQADRSSQSASRSGDEITLAKALEGEDARVSKLVGKEVMSPDGDTLGEVEDLLATREQDEPTVVISVGGVLDVGDKWYATSFDELTVANGKLVLDKSEAELAQEPPFDYVPRAGESSDQPGVSGPGTTNSIAGLLGATVIDERGTSIGEIDDLVVSSDRGHGVRAIVELNDNAGPAAEDRLVAIPFDDLVVEESGEEAAGLPQQPKVRANFEDTPIEALPAYEYSKREVI